MYYVARERGINASPMAASFGPFLAESRKGRKWYQFEKLKFAVFSFGNPHNNIAFPFSVCYIFKLENK